MLVPATAEQYSKIDRRFRDMKPILFVSLVLFSATAYSQNLQAQECRPTINLRATVFPNENDSTYMCPPGRCCYQKVIATNNNYEVIGFRLTAYNLCDGSGDIWEISNTGYWFSPMALRLLSAPCNGLTLDFTCIKAKNKSGQIFTLQPFSITIK